VKIIRFAEAEAFEAQMIRDPRTIDSHWPRLL